MSDQIALQYPLGTYSSGNPPSNGTLMGDLSTIQDTVNAIGDELSALETGKATVSALTAHEAATSVHGTTGAVVGTTDSQTLTNKTLTNPIINSMQYSGWNTLPSLAWVSTDGSTNVVNATGDLTTTISPGMRIKTQQDQALTAYWPMDANSNTTVGSFNGTDTAVTYTAGKFSNAATFNGTTSKIVITDNASLKPTGEFTLGCWFKTGNTGALKMLFQSWSANTANAGIYLGIDATNVIKFKTGKNTGITAGTDYAEFLGTTTVTDNAFHYVVASFRNNYLQVYLDGRLEVSGYMMTPVYAATNYVRVGCGSNTGTDASFMNGQIDDLFLINGYALDEKTIKAKYDAQTAQGTGAITVDKYALVTAVAPYAAGVTPITIWGGTDYSLANATISNPYYATVAQPFGFPRQQEKWMTEFSSSAAPSQVSAVQNTWYNIGSQQLSVPIGSWNIEYNVSLQNGSVGGFDLQVTLSTANNSSSESLFDTYVGYAAQYYSAPVYKRRGKTLSAKTTYYLNSRTLSTGSPTLTPNGSVSPTIIRATSTLL